MQERGADSDDESVSTVGMQHDEAGEGEVEGGKGGSDMVINSSDDNEGEDEEGYASTDLDESCVAQPSCCTGSRSRSSRSSGTPPG